MESRESSSVDSQTQHTADVRRSEGVVVVRLRDHFTATRACCSAVSAGTGRTYATLELAAISVFEAKADWMDIGFLGRQALATK
jgi:hypothetical protein